MTTLDMQPRGRGNLPQASNFSVIDPYQAVLPRLNLQRALERLTPNDLLPARPEEKVRGELGPRFIESLREELENGGYDPQVAHFVSMPRSTYANRPAALVRLDDRVVFASLVSAIESRITKHLLGPDLVLWPRGTTDDPPWADFEHAPLHSDQRYILRADIAAFYESIGHHRLAQKITAATGRRAIANALRSFLGQLMQSDRGLPQGLRHSDSLATLYLADVDFAMTRAGYEYYRVGDDMRVACADYGEASRAVTELERSLHALGLILNTDKTRIFKRETYEKHRYAVEAALTDAEETRVEQTLAALEEDEDALIRALRASGLPDADELEFRVFYHGAMEFEEIVEKLAPTITPSKAETAVTLFAETVRRRPGQPNALDRGDFRACLGKSLALLTAAKSTAGLPYVEPLFGGSPENLRRVCTYLLAIATKAPQQVVLQAETALQNDAHLTEWKLAWLVRILLKHPQRVSADTMELLIKRVEEPAGGWLGVVGIIELLAARGELDRTMFVRVANTSPPVLRADLIVAVTRIGAPEPWAEAYLSAARSSRLDEAVARRTWT